MALRKKGLKMGSITIDGKHVELKETVNMQWKRLTDTAKGPQKAHYEDAAWDLYAD